MRQTIRFNTFETNSSSTHSMCIIPDKQYKDWTENKLYYMRWTYGHEKLLEENNGSRLFTEEFLRSHNLLIDEPKEEDFEDANAYEEAYEEWEDNNLEDDHEEYTTESGDTIHILCRYGCDY